MVFFFFFFPGLTVATLFGHGCMSAVVQRIYDVAFLDKITNKTCAANLVSRQTTGTLDVA